MIHGFEISHFRNFGEEPQTIAPLGKINIFVGSNNSGKSNVLRYIRDYLAPSLADTRGDKVQLSAENRSRFCQTDPDKFIIYVPIDNETIDSKFTAPSGPQQEAFRATVRGFPKTTSDGQYIGIPVRRQATNANQRAFAEMSDTANVDARNLEILARISGAGHLNTQQAMNFVLNRLLVGNVDQISTVYVPAFRQIKTRLSVFSNEYENAGNDDTHIIDQLVEFSNPTYGQQQKRKSFEKLQNFIADITLIDDISIDIPHDRSTINVEIGGYKRPIETLGSGVHELFMLASLIVLNEGKTILLEEPEIHLHPAYQRKLMSFLRDEIEGQFFVTTHSPAVIDTPEAKVFGVRSDGGAATIEPLIKSQRRHEICRELGYRASDLLQSNCIIWVEGPSDRLYLNYWISSLDPAVKEGIDYSIMFYGGKLLSHLSVEDSYVEEFISLLPINRHVAIVMDSDLGAAHQELRGTKIRVREQIEASGGLSWVTKGREIENYVPAESRELAIQKAHPSAVKLSGSRNRFGKPLNYRKRNGDEVTSGFNKIRIAKECVAAGFSMTELDLTERVETLVKFIRKSNDLPT
uniref:ATP-dependent nuclease n=1 Tax=Parerythrobacter lutipelagi TaxID=1964208 RepID=UPI0010FA0681|nr:ATP-binding protein [Parerythrobacter lutipelagi]